MYTATFLAASASLLSLSSCLALPQSQANRDPTNALNLTPLEITYLDTLYNQSYFEDLSDTGITYSNKGATPQIISQTTQPLNGDTIEWASRCQVCPGPTFPNVASFDETLVSTINNPQTPPKTVVPTPSPPSLLVFTNSTTEGPSYTDQACAWFEQITLATGANALGFLITRQVSHPVYITMERLRTFRDTDAALWPGLFSQCPQVLRALSRDCVCHPPPAEGSALVQQRRGASGGTAVLRPERKYRPDYAPFEGPGLRLSIVAGIEAARFRCDAGSCLEVTQ
ncbi:MAG: hypothetical protein M1817_005095 [Caeruleum heppii]|nr:MAG: hypothetical protein M1817_005095 [Caeruleum heppii]